MVEIATGDPTLDANIKQWLEWSLNEANTKIVKDYISQKKYDQLKAMMSKRLDFSVLNSPGLHAEQGPGFAHINDLSIVQAGQGILKYLEKTDKTNLKQNGVLIGFDHRTNNKHYAELVTAIFLRANYSVKLFKEFITTPLVAFGTALFRCSFGIMITGNCDSKNYSGMRVFTNKGTGIISPMDKEIQELIMKNLEPWENSADLEVLENNKLLINPTQKTLLEYLNNIAKGIITHHKEINRRAAITFTYTCIHGIVFKYASKVFELTNLKLLPVPEQKDPNPDFPTVKKPDIQVKTNLDLAYKFAEEQKSGIIFFNDPTGRRLCVAEKNNKSGRWYTFTEYEMSAILAWWSLFCYKERFPKESLKEIFMVNTIVSTKILHTMAVKEGFNNVECYIGFNYIGAKMEELKRKNRKVLLAVDETMCYACGNDNFVSDGAIAAYQVATCCSLLYMDGLLLTDKLSEIWNTYGYHISKTGYYTASDHEKIDKIFDVMRNCGGKNKYTTTICNKKFTVQRVKDYTTGYDSDVDGVKDILPFANQIQMIHYAFKNGFYITLRKTMTYISIQYYMELQVEPEQVNRDVTMSLFNEMADGAIVEFLDPAKNELISGSD